MLKFEKIIETATSRMEPIALNHQRCSRVRSHLGKCSKCIECCPVEGIIIKNSKIELNDNCIQCGLCASVCPTGAISIQEPTELNLYNYIEEEGKLDNTVILTCKHNDDISKSVFKVPCLGGLTLEFLLGIDTLPFEINVIFSQAKCKECIVKSGIDLYLNNIKKIKRIEEDLNLLGGSIKNTEKVPKVKTRKTSTEEIDNERREFLFSIFKSVKKLPNTAIKYVLGTNDDDDEKSNAIVASPTVKKYPILGKVFSKIKGEELINSEIIDYSKPSLVGTCTFCRACTMLCPMGALKYIEKGDKLSLFLLRDACSGCGLCVEVCYYGALELKSKTIKDFSFVEPSILAAGTKQRCSICKQIITASNTVEICSSCLKLGRIYRR
jgi:ferredoxin